jgi:hypothetical protein
MPKDSRHEELAQQARFVFKGTVQKLKAATMRDVKVDARTATVRVDEIIHAPESLSNFAGKNITVQLGGRKKVSKGKQAVFYTNPWLFGESVAVESIDQEEVLKVPAALATVAVDPVKSLAQRDTKTQFDSADAIVSGRVTNVRVPSDVVAARSLAAAEPAISVQVSEHDPDWRIAEVQVDAVHKGSHSGTAQIRFPASTDVMWHYAPKFHAGQEGFFMLHKAAKKDVAAAAALSAPAEDTGDYVALNPADFHPFDQAEGVRSLLEE